MEFSVSKEHGATFTRYGGKVTHPLTVVTLQGEETGKKVVTTAANKTGFWNATVENALYPMRADGTPDRLIAYYQKTDLTGSAPSAPVKGGEVEPILNYVEGYAYDSAGKPLPQAGVGFRQQATDKIVYVTTSDNTGYFKIPTRYLPTFGYELVFLPTGATEPTFMTTSVFTAKNAPLLKQKGVNLLTSRNDEFINPKSVPSQPVSKSSPAVEPTGLVMDLADKKASANMALLVASIVFLLLAGVGTVAFLIYKKQKSKDQPGV